MFQKILVDKRMKTAYKNEQNKITEYFALKKPEDIQYVNVEKEEDIKEETKKIPYARVDQYQKKVQKKKQKKMLVLLFSQSLQNKLPKNSLLSLP